MYRTRGNGTPPSRGSLPSEATSRTTGGLIEDYRKLRLPGDDLSGRATGHSLERWRIHWGRRPAYAITSHDIDLYLRELALKEFSPREIDRERWYLSFFFGWLHHNGFIVSNPLECIFPLPKRPKQRTVIWSLPSQRRLLLACRRKRRGGNDEATRHARSNRAGGEPRDEPPHYLYPLVRLALETGLRLGNLVYLEWRHIDLLTDTLRIPASEVRGGRAIEFQLPPRPARLLHRLWDILTRRAYRPALVLEPLGLPRDGGAPDEPTIHEDLRRACRRAGIPPGDFDSLRKTFAWNSARSGVSFLKTATIVDWGDLGGLVDVYHRMG